MNEAYYYNSFATSNTSDSPGANNHHHHHYNNNKSHHEHHQRLLAEYTQHPKPGHNQYHYYSYYPDPDAIPSSHHHKKQHQHHHHDTLITPENALDVHHPHRRYIAPPLHHTYHQFQEGSAIQNDLDRIYSQGIDKLNPFDYSHDSVQQSSSPLPPPPQHFDAPPVAPSEVVSPQHFDAPPVAPTPSHPHHPSPVITHDVPPSPVTHHQFHRHHHYVGEDLGGGVLYDPTGSIANRQNADINSEASTKPGILDDHPEPHASLTSPSSGINDNLGSYDDGDMGFTGGSNDIQSALKRSHDFLSDSISSPSPSSHSTPPIAHHQFHRNHHLPESHITAEGLNMGNYITQHDLGEDHEGSDDFIGNDNKHPTLNRTPLMENVHDGPGLIDSQTNKDISNLHDLTDILNRQTSIEEQNRAAAEKKKQDDANPLNQIGNFFSNLLGGGNNNNTAKSNLAIGGAMNSIPSGLKTKHKAKGKLGVHAHFTHAKEDDGGSSGGNLNKNNDYNKYMNDIIGQIKSNSYIFMDAGLIGLGALLALPKVGIHAIPPAYNKLAWTASLGAIAIGIIGHMANPGGRAFAGHEGGGGGGPHGGAGHFEHGGIGGHEHGGEHGFHGGHEHGGFHGGGWRGGRWVGGRWVAGYPYYGYGYPYPGYPPAYPYPEVPYPAYPYPYYGYPGWGGFYGGRYGFRGYGHLGHFGGHEGGHFEHGGGGHEGGHEGGHAGGGGGHSHAHNARSFFAPAIFPERSYFNHKKSFKNYEKGVTDQTMLNPSDVLLPREIDTSHYILGSRPAIIDSNHVPSPLISDVY